MPALRHALEAIHFKDYVMSYCPEEQTGGRVLKDRRLSTAVAVATRTFSLVPAATLGESFNSFFDAVDQFFSNLASVRPGPLVLALILFATYLTFRARASFNILRAAYPSEPSASG